MKITKKIAALILILSVVIVSTTAVSANPKPVVSGNLTASAAFDMLDMKSKQTIYAPIVQQILDDYSNIYHFDNFEFQTHPFEKDGKEYLAIDVIVDMTLTQHPSENPYFQGMAQGINSSVSSSNEKELLHSQMNTRMQTIIDECYMVPDRTTFTYAIESDVVLNMARHVVNKLNLGNYYYRVDADEPILYHADKLATPVDELKSYNTGYAEVFKMQTDPNVMEAVTRPALTANYTYDRIGARDWALTHALETPEYPSNEVSGTDCANFVSKAIHAGNIPEDVPGKWYGSSTWGGWAGINWIRTGNRTDGGVVPYMVDNGFFYAENDLTTINAGCIMSWVNISHVALVTYGDTVTIKYTQHSPGIKNAVYRSSETDANFYMYY